MSTTTKENPLESNRSADIETASEKRGGAVSAEVPVYRKSFFLVAAIAGVAILALMIGLFVGLRDVEDELKTIEEEVAPGSSSAPAPAPGPCVCGGGNGTCTSDEEHEFKAAPLRAEKVAMHVYI